MREGAVMDAGNSIGPEGVASFMAAVEKMPQPRVYAGPERVAAWRAAVEKMPQLRVYAALVGFGTDFGLLID